MNTNQSKIHYGFLTATTILFSVELLIALFVSGFIRAYVGDTLVVVLIYCFLRTFYTGAKTDNTENNTTTFNITEK